MFSMIERKILLQIPVQRMNTVPLRRTYFLSSFTSFLFHILNSNCYIYQITEMPLYKCIYSCCEEESVDKTQKSDCLT